MTIHDAFELRPELTKQQRYDARRYAAGTCIRCGKVAVTARHCAHHRDRQNDKRRADYVAKHGGDRRRDRYAKGRTP